MGRNVGNRMLIALTILEEIGPCRCGQVFERVPGVSNIKNTTNYLKRALRLGWVTMEGEPYHREYTVVPDWREKIKDSMVRLRAISCVTQRIVKEEEKVKIHHLQRFWRAGPVEE